MMGEVPGWDVLLVMVSVGVAAYAALHQRRRLGGGLLLPLAGGDEGARVYHAHHTLPRPAVLPPVVAKLATTAPHSALGGGRHAHAGTRRAASRGRAGARGGRRVALWAGASLDYNDPVVMAEYAECQKLSDEEIEEQLIGFGIAPPPGVAGVDLQLMLMEVRVRMKPKDSGGAPPESASKWEKALYEFPRVQKILERVRSEQDHNRENVMIEFFNNPEMAVKRNATGYQDFLDELQAATNVESPKLRYSGFPAGMGEDAIKMTFEAFGELQSFEFGTSDDGMTAIGIAEFADIAAAKAAQDKWDGTDMGLGMALELKMF